MANPGSTTTPSARGCTACGASNPAQARFCGHCGAGLPPLSPGNTLPGSVAGLLDDARQHMLLGHWEDAGLAAEAVLTLEPDSAEAHHIAARSRLKQGMVASGLTHAERAIALDPDNREYQSTLAEALRQGEPAGFPVGTPAIVASVVAFLVLAIIVVLVVTNQDRGEPQVAATPAPEATASSPFSQPQANTFPQPNRPSGVSMDRPRIPARSAQPGPTDIPQPESASPMASRPVAPGPAMPTTPMALPPAPVDATQLQRFPEPVAPQPPSTQRPAATPNTAPATPPSPLPRWGSQRLPSEPTSTLPPVVTPPQPTTGGSIFGSAPRTPATETPPRDDGTVAAPTPVQPTAPTARPPAAASPQSLYVQRDYGAAIQGFERQIASGNATGSTYQQLGLAYERVGDRQRAMRAYQDAVNAYRAQIQAGQDADMATRGLRSTERALAMLRAR